MAECLHHAQSLSKPDLILNTGDCVMDTLHVDRAPRRAAVGRLATACSKPSARLPIAALPRQSRHLGLGARIAAAPPATNPAGARSGRWTSSGWPSRITRSTTGRGEFIMLDSVPAGARRRLGSRNSMMSSSPGSKRSWRRRSKPVLIGSHVPIVLAGGVPRQRPDRRHAGRARARRPPHVTST